MNRAKQNNRILIVVATNIILLLWGMFVNCDLLFWGLITLWTNMMYYCISNIGQRVILFAFGISFFVFLLGRDTLIQLFLYEKTPFSDETNTHAYISMICALLGVWIAYSICERKYSKTNNPIQSLKSNDIYIYFVRKYSKFCFYATYPFAIALNLFIAAYVIRNGYYNFYTDFREVAMRSPVVYTLSKIELIMPAAFAIFMSTIPNKIEFKKLVKLYVIYLVVTLFCGARSPFLLGLLTLFVFVVYMQSIFPNENWVSKKTIKRIVIAVPFIVISSTLYNVIRFGREINGFSIFDGFEAFFYEQGVTSNIVKRAYDLEETIPVQDDFYSFEFLHTGIIARILGNEVYQGNTIEHALKGGSFTYALGYTVMGDTYLAGGGTGSSYIAELYYDFGYVGVFLGSCIYGIIFASITNFKNVGLFRRSLSFVVMTQLLWAPRAAFSAFLSFIFAPSTLFLLLIVFGGAYISEHRVKKIYNR